MLGFAGLGFNSKHEDDKKALSTLKLDEVEVLIRDNAPSQRRLRHITSVSRVCSYMKTPVGSPIYFSTNRESESSAVSQG